MRLLIFGDLMGRAELIPALNRLSRMVDYSIFTGDMPNPGVFKYLRQKKVLNKLAKIKDVKKELIDDTLPTPALKKSTQEVVKINQLLTGQESKLYGVLGNADLYLYTQYTNWAFQLLHKKIVSLNNYSLIGYNGRPLYVFEKSNPNEPTFSEEEIYQDLKQLLSQTNPCRTILITHVPPFKILDQVLPEMIPYAQKTYGQSAKEGNIGSQGLRQIVDEHKPLLHIFAHVHESKGVFYHSHTFFINIGSTGETDEACLVEIKNSNIKVQFVSLTS